VATNRSVVVYSTPTCGPCKAAKAFLASKGVAFQEVNVAEDLEGREALIRQTGQLAVPVIVVGDEVVLGFNRPRLAEVLGIESA
jgi:glutaredoxin-like YruB-family protein